jgi:hypothetical protein
VPPSAAVALSRWRAKTLIFPRWRAFLFVWRQKVCLLPFLRFVDFLPPSQPHLFIVAA